MRKIWTLTTNHEFYPRFLSLIKNPTLFGLGTINSQTFTHTVGIVGSRLITDYGKEILFYIIPQLVKKGWTTISGFSYGVDEYVHKLTIKNNGKTVAILPCGIQKIIPKRNALLFNQVLKKRGLFLSEYEKDQPCDKWTFASRNRIIAALSDFLIIVEADKKSGSLITADFGFSFGKPVFFIPHRLFDKNSIGVNELFKKGGIPITRISPLTLEPWFNLTRTPNLTKLENDILNLVKSRAYSADEIGILLQKPLDEIIKAISSLEMHKLIINKGGYYHVC